MNTMFCLIKARQMWHIVYGLADTETSYIYIMRIEFSRISIEDTVIELLGNLVDKGRCLSVDNYYNSFILARTLLSNKKLSYVERCEIEEVA